MSWQLRPEIKKLSSTFSLQLQLLARFRGLPAPPLDETLLRRVLSRVVRTGAAALFFRGGDFLCAVVFDGFAGESLSDRSAGEAPAKPCATWVRVPAT
jgi:hypothetical protein